MKKPGLSSRIEDGIFPTVGQVYLRSGNKRISPLRIAIASVLLALMAIAGTGGTAGAAPPYDIRGEWTYTIVCGCGVSAPGEMRLLQMNFTTGAFTGTTILSESFPGTASGTVAGSQTSLSLHFPHTSFGESTFTVNAATIEPTKNELAGSGTFSNGFGGTIKAKRVGDLEQAEEKEKEEAERAQEAKEKAEKEAKEREIKEAEEKPIREKEEAERHELEAKEAQEAKERQQLKEQQEAKEAKEAQEAKETQEAKAKQAKEQQEAKAKQEAKEREEKAAKEAPAPSGPSPSGPTGPATKAPTPAKPNTKTLAVSGSGVVLLELSNPNAFGISGSVALAAGAKTSGAMSKHKSTPLAQSAFAIASHGTKLVKLKLSRSAAAALADHRSLRVLVEITTRAAGQLSTTKTYGITLQSQSRTRH